MRIFLVRHGKASKDPQYTLDAVRPLTDRGREDATKVATLMARSGIEVHQLRHSGLLRAEQTAEIFAAHLNPPGGVIAVAGLLFDDPVDVLADELHLEPEPVMLVGHNPFMERLTSQLLTGSPVNMPVCFTTSCTAYLEYMPDASWSLRWVLNREIVDGVEM